LEYQVVQVVGVVEDLRHPLHPQQVVEVLF
jgi:hypothetical protein